MVGNLTVDKASLNLSYFLKSIKIISDKGGRILRQDFVNEMAKFMGTYAIKDGKENRTPYNKLKQVQYFGFSMIKKDEEGTWLCLTRRGEILSTLISEKSSEDNPEKRYYIEPEKLPIVRKMFVYDLLYNSYGRNNCGAEQSKTDTEPPKVIVRLLATIGNATCNELCYAIYALNGGKNGNVREIEKWEDIVSFILSKRDQKYDYSHIFERWGIENIVQDFKIVNLLANPSIDVIRELNGAFYLSPDLDTQYVKVFENLPYYYKPLSQLFNNKQNEIDEVITWVLDAVINKNEDDPDLAILDIRIDEDIMRNNIEKVVIHSLASSKNNTYLLVISNSKIQLQKSFGPYQSLLRRIDDVKSLNNGESVEEVSGLPIKKFPSNLHIVTIIINH